MRRYWALALLLATGSCAYYNGLYNANRLVGEARKAEREGRSGDARSYWSRVVVKADTVLARYPHSQYRDDALFLKGLALSELGSCAGAIDPLQLVIDSSPDPVLVDRSRLHLGGCMLRLGHNDSALALLEPLAESESGLRDDARWLTGRTLHRLGNDAAARTYLETTRADSAGFDLALVSLALGDPAGARAVLDNFVERPYVEASWLPLLDALGAQDRRGASDLTERLVSRRGISRGQKARLILADGRRFEAVNPELALDRYREARTVAGDYVEAGIARVRAVLVRLKIGDDTLAISGLAAELRSASAGGGTPSELAAPALAVLDAIEADTAGGPIADLNRFVHAERLRDEIGARRLAGAFFLAVVRDYPNSVIAPKALIAAGDVGADIGGEVLGLLRSRYPQSPYTLAAMGIATERFGVVEDSLRALMERVDRNGLSEERRRRLSDEESPGEIVN